MATSAKTIRVLLIDDEPLAREMIREMLEGDSEVEIIGECVNGEEAAAAIKEHAPDLLFLDVQMPEANGFEVHALDYLLKP
ncbi:MAG TPA: response regulator, partial [Pyrinomonadaceae bacterium]|nr:response regulator [Pyrinomonadaceae bacterium]